MHAWVRYSQVLGGNTNFSLTREILVEKSLFFVFFLLVVNKELVFDILISYSFVWVKKEKRWVFPWSRSVSQLTKG